MTGDLGFRRRRATNGGTPENRAEPSSAPNSGGAPATRLALDSAADPDHDGARMAAPPMLDAAMRDRFHVMRRFSPLDCLDPSTVI